jgi:hypothetical protein
VTIGRLGVYYRKEQSFYYAPWMHNHIGTKTNLFGDIFDQHIVHVHNAISGKFLGTAKRNRQLPITNFQHDRDLLNAAIAARKAKTINTEKGDPSCHSTTLL